jgi:hypothetical protein
MGIFEHVRKGTNPQAKAQALHNAIAAIGEARVRLYLDERAVEDQFVQRRNALDEVVTGREIGAEIGAGYLGFLSGKGSGKATAAERIELTPFIRALLVEDAERERGALVDLSREEPRDGPLLFFLGPGRIFLSNPYEPVVELVELGLQPKAAQALEAERNVQAAAFGDDRGMLVWVGPGRKTLASIAAASFSAMGPVVSYRQHPPHGLLGIFEQELDGVALIKALFLWRQAPAA